MHTCRRVGSKRGSRPNCKAKTPMQPVLEDAAEAKGSGTNG